MGNFESALAYTIKNEGGYSNDPHDKGGPTIWGIQLTEWNDWIGYPISLTDFKALTPKDVEAIYLSQYWKPLQLDQVMSSPIATAIFDMGVNDGIHTSAKISQRALNAIGQELVVDGWLGPKSLLALNEATPKSFIPAFQILIHDHYNDIVTKDPTQVVFLKTWMNRCKRLSTLIV